MPLDAVAQEYEAVVDMGDVGFGLRQRQPHGRLGVLAAAVDSYHEVIGVSSQPIVRQSLPPTHLALVGSGRLRCPKRGEVLIEHAQGDVGQQRREDASLGVPVVVSFSCASLVRMPALRNALTSTSTRLSPTRRRTRSIKAVWSMVSKHALMSPSTTRRHLAALLVR